MAGVNGDMKAPFTVTGMNCSACSAWVERCVRALHGVRQVQVNLLTKSMAVEWDESLLDADAIIAAVCAAGYGAAPAGEPAAPADASAPVLRRLLFSLLFLLPLAAVAHLLQGGLSLLLQAALLLPILWLNRKFFIGGTKALLQGAPNMDTLIALGAAAGIIYTLCDVAFLHSGSVYLESAGMILTLITLGKWLEARATGQTGRALEALRALLPDTARVLRGGDWVELPAAELRAGDTLLVRAGERIPADAEVLSGQSFIDESALTGESMPVEKSASSAVYGGTVNGNGVLELRATHSCADSALSGIIRMVGDAAASKAPIARVADAVSGVFVPAVAALALLTALLWLLCGATPAFAMGCAIAVLVISCPCALGLATPVAIMVGAGKGAENGVLFRSGATLERLRGITAVILDKTGTVTEGRPAVTDVLPAAGVSREELLAVAGALEAQGNHPLAAAVAEAAGKPVLEAASHTYIPGRGVTAIVGGVACAAGNALLMQELGAAPDESAAAALAEQGKTPLFFARGGRYIGCIAVADAVKRDSAAAVVAMRAAGLRVLMMTGDNPRTAAAVAQRAGISEYQAGVLPQDKAAMVRRLQQEGHAVAVIGDGINDAPALTAADVGIAIGSGADAACESAGVILMRGKLTDAVAALRLSRAVMRVIRQNLFWAFFYNVAAIPLAAGVWYPLFGLQLSPAVAAAAMSLSSFCVVCNALRLRTLPLHPRENNKMTTLTLKVEGMMCPHCERHVAEALLALPNITACKADHNSATVTLELSAPADMPAITAAVTKAGYVCRGEC